MNLDRHAKFWAFSLSALLLWPSLAWAQQVTSPAAPQDQQVQAVESVLADLQQVNVVYLGETHDSPADHAAQLEIIQALQQRNPKLAIAMEMFQRPFQPALDQYLQGDITANQLRLQSEYDQRWGFPWAYYSPILEFARDQQLPVLALNAPAEVTRQVAQKGWDSLSESDRQWVPPRSDVDTSSVGYRQLMRQIYDDFHQVHGSSAGFENFFLTQVLWDETMAAGIAEFLTAHPDYQVVVLAGQGHVIYGYGIPSRVARRLADTPDFSQRLLLLNPATTSYSKADGEIADYFWRSDP